MLFARERIESVIGEIGPLAELHFQEIGEAQGFHFEPDLELYQRIEEAGSLVIYTARKQAALLGYQIFFLSPHLFSRGNTLATQNLLYMHPKARSSGMSFIRWCDEHLKSIGVHIVRQSVTPHKDFRPVLERIGYEFSEWIYERRV